MDRFAEIVETERQLWKNDVDLYGASLTPDATLLFPETGPITRETALDAIKVENEQGRHWAEVEFEDATIKDISPDVAALIYKVTARWAHENEPIHALASSIYVNRDGHWKLALHQQSAIA
jgi:hypothetical protein